jgi:hypothetical protein
MKPEVARMKKALVVALLGAMMAGCGVAPTAQSTKLNANSASSGVVVDSKMVAKLKARALDARVGPAPGKQVAERPMTDQEKNGTYLEVLTALFAEGQKSKGGGLTEVSVDSMGPDMKVGANSTFKALFLPTGNFGGVVEVIAANGKVTTYDWGFGKTLQWMQMKQMTGEQVMDIKNPTSMQSLTELLTKAKMLPMPANIDSVNTYLNMMPRRKPDLSVEWFPAYIVVTYEGHYAQGKMVANANTGDIYAPKP